MYGTGRSLEVCDRNLQRQCFKHCSYYLAKSTLKPGSARKGMAHDLNAEMVLGGIVVSEQWLPNLAGLSSALGARLDPC